MLALVGPVLPFLRTIRNQNALSKSSSVEVCIQSFCDPVDACRGTGVNVHRHQKFPNENRLARALVCRVGLWHVHMKHLCKGRQTTNVCHTAML